MTPPPVSAPTHSYGCQYLLVITSFIMINTSIGLMSIRNHFIILSLSRNVGHFDFHSHSNYIKVRPMFYIRLPSKCLKLNYS